MESQGKEGFSIKFLTMTVLQNSICFHLLIKLPTYYIDVT